MNYTGIWKIHSAMTFSENGPVYRTLDEMKADPNYSPDQGALFSLLTIFCEDGAVYTALEIPANISKEDIETARSQGAQIIDDRYLVRGEACCWKEEDGKVFYNTGIHGSVLDEEMSPWIPVREDEEGMIFLPMLRLERA